MRFLAKLSCHPGLAICVIVANVHEIAIVPVDANRVGWLLRELWRPDKPDKGLNTLASITYQGH
jgi:hypothetical protein